MDTIDTNRFELTVLERVVGYWAGITALIALVLVVSSFARFVTTTF